MPRQIFLSKLKYRLVAVVLAAIIFVTSFYLGAVSTVNSDEARDIVAKLSEKRSSLDKFQIFKNNIWPALIMFVPGLGIVFGANAGFSTGFSIAALALLNPMVRSIQPISVFWTTFGLIELIAYSIAMSRSGLLVYYLIRKRKSWKDYAIFTGVEIGIVIVLLFLGAIIEWNLLQ